MVSELVFVQVSIAPYGTIFRSEKLYYLLCSIILLYLFYIIWCLAYYKPEHQSSHLPPGLRRYHCSFPNKTGRSVVTEVPKPGAGNHEEDAAAGSDAGNPGGPAVYIFFYNCKHLFSCVPVLPCLILSLSLFHHMHT